MRSAIVLPPILRHAQRDRRLRKHQAFLVLTRLVEALGTSERPMFAAVIARAVDLDERTVARAFTLLVACGYLTCTEPDVRGVRRYRLVFLPAQRVA